MKPFSFLVSSRRSAAFSLIELLAVLAIVGMLAALALPMMSRSDSFRGSLVILSGVLDQARQFAIARNTPVWVVFSESPDGLLVAIVASLEGADAEVWSGVPLTLGENPSLALIGRVRKLSGVALADPGDLPVPSLPVADGVRRLEIIHLTIAGGGGEKIFDRAVQFASTGEAKVRTPARFVEWGIRPSPSAPGNPNAAVFRLAALTGHQAIFRP